MLDRTLRRALNTAVQVTVFGVAAFQGLNSRLLSAPLASTQFDLQRAADKCGVCQLRFPAANWAFRLYTFLSNPVTTAEQVQRILEQLHGLQGKERIPILIQLVETSESDSRATLEATETLLELLADYPNPEIESRTRNSRSWALQCTGDYDQARAQAIQAKALAEQCEARAPSARASYMLAVIAYRLAEYEDALKLAAHALDVQRELQDSSETATCLTLLGAIHRSMSDYLQSIEYHMQALKISEDLGDAPGISRSHNNIGLIYWKLGRLEDAYESLRLALKGYGEPSFERNRAMCLSNLGLVLVDLDRPSEALGPLSEALGLHRKNDNPHGISKVLSNLGFAHHASENLEEALSLYQQTLELREELGDKHGLVRTLGCIAEVHQDKGEHEEAIRWLRDSYDLAVEIKVRSEQAAVLEMLSKSHYALGNYKEALEYLESFHELEKELAGPELQERIAQLESAAELEKQEREIENLNQLAAGRKQDLEQQNAAQRRLLLGSGLLLGCLATLLLVLYSRARALRLVRRSNAELRETTSRLAESEQRYRQLFDSADVPTLLIDEATHAVLDLNRPAKQICQSEAAARVDQVEPEWLRMGLSKLLLGTGREEHSYDSCRTESTGQTRWTEFRGCSVQVNGRQAMLISARDTTERRAQEKARIQADKLESLGYLAGGIAHDFNNALTAIQGHICVARLGSEAQVVKDLDSAELAIHQAARLTSQLLAFAKGGEPVLRVRDVGVLLRDASELASAGSSMHVEIDVPDDLWRAELDSGQFIQVVSNLVVNAEQATGDQGQLEIVASNFRGDPQIGSSPSGSEFVRIDFTDNGVGIPADSQSHIFDPYFSTKADGNGLGLTTAFTIVTRHGGTMTFTSVQGRGTSFSVFLPATHADLRSSQQQYHEYANGSGKILVLDDEPLVQSFLKKLLTQWGYQVESVFDGAEAVRRYTETFEAGEPFDVLLMDLTIPGGLGGQEALAEILRIDPSARAVVCSGYSGSPVLARYREAGFAASLAKPFRIEELARVLRGLSEPQLSSDQSAIEQTDVTK